MPLKLVHRQQPDAARRGTTARSSSPPATRSTSTRSTSCRRSPACTSSRCSASPREIARLIKTHFGVGSETVAALVAGARRGRRRAARGHRGRRQRAGQEAQEASVVQLVNEILIEAANERASDVHIEPEEHGLRIRYRIDGMLQTQPLPPEINRFQAAIISRLKIMARLNIAEKRLPQDGRIKLQRRRAARSTSACRSSR